MNETENRFREFEEFDGFSDIDENNLIFEFLRKPKAVYKYLFKTNPKKYFWPLLIIAGAAEGLENGLERMDGFANTSYSIGVIFGALLAGGALGWISYFITAWILKVFGSTFLNGTATAKDFRVVAAWGNIPSIATVFISILTYAFYGFEINSISPNLSEMELYIIMILGFISTGLAIWSIILYIIGTMHIQNFSAGKATLNVLAPFIILVIIVAVFVYSIYL